ncbi:MAG: response regulator [Thermodesulfobacteriota bacterium]|nr:response regulator [Thermodesulfobacteriota bacterium]
MAKKIKVLMVDDEERFRETTSKLLKKRGFATTIAKNGEEAITIIKDKPQDVVILDIKMDGMDGHEALTEIKKIDPEVQVIMLTGHGTPDSAIKAFVKQAFDYLNKPCDLDTLSAKIHDAYTAKNHGVSRETKKARDIMLHIDDYTTVNVDTSVQEAIKKLMESFKSSVSSSRLMETGHRSLLVFDDKKKLAGVLCIMDLIKAARPAYLSAPKPSMADSVQYSSMFWDGLFTTQTKAMVDKKVGDLMSETPSVVDENTNLMEVADLMYSTQLRRIIVTANDNIIGIIREQEIFFEMANIIL